MPYARGGKTAQATVRPAPVRNAYTPMFERFRDELDEHHDRRERIIKASRDVTALSKKIVRKIEPDLPAAITKEARTRLQEISRNLALIAPDVQGINRWRYARQLMCLEELIEALTFSHYLQHQELASYRASIDFVADACRKGAAERAMQDEKASQESATSMDVDETKQLPEVLEAEKRVDMPIIELSEADYFGGVFDLTGEVMRFATVTAALNGELAGRPAVEGAFARTVCSDMQELRSFFEMLPPPQKFDRVWIKKMEIMRTSVRKVERLGYELRVRGSERPKGWMPDEEVVGGGEED